MRFSMKEYHERFFISKGTIRRFFKIELNERGCIVPVVKRKQYEELISGLLQERIDEIKQRYGGERKIVDVRVVPFSHVFQNDEMMPNRHWETMVHVRYVLPEIEKAWKDFDLYITVKEIVGQEGELKLL